MLEQIDLISQYTREQAIDAGILVDVTTVAKQAGIRWPTAVTRSVWEDYVQWLPEGNEQLAQQAIQGRLWDILSMLKGAMEYMKGDSYYLDFTFNYFKYEGVLRYGYQKNSAKIKLKAIFKRGDNGEPVLTIMKPKEN